MINLGSTAEIRDLAGFYTFELITETNLAGVQRNIFQVIVFFFSLLLIFNIESNVFYLRQGGNVFARHCLSVCLSVCV